MRDEDLNIDDMRCTESPLQDKFFNERAFCAIF
jgi:hypothetical protein